MNIIKKNLNNIIKKEEFLKIYKKKLFIKGSFIFKTNNFNFIDTLIKENFFYPEKKSILIKKKIYKNNNIYISDFTKFIYKIKVLKIFLFFKKKKKPILKCRVLKCKTHFLLLGFQGLIFKINKNQNVSKNIQSIRKWKKYKYLYKLKSLLFFFHLDNNFQIYFSRKIILKILKKKNATI